MTPKTETAETFGHEPQWFNVGYCGGCPECGDREETEACIRCGIEWPCATATVLGVADLEPADENPRPTAAPAV